MDRYERSVVDVMEELAGYVTGAGGDPCGDRFDELLDWLEWRVEDGWLTNYRAGEERWSMITEHDVHIRAAARAIVRAARLVRR